jgi:hypothetical protein
MACTMNVASILKTWLEMKSSVNFLHSRNISHFHITFNKYLAREARVMRKMLGNKAERCVFYTFIVSLNIWEGTNQLLS